MNACHPLPRFAVPTMSMMTCGRFETLSPPKTSIATVVARLNRSYGDCASAVAATVTALTSSANAVLCMRVLDEELAAIGGDGRQSCRERFDDVGVELGAGATSQFAQRVA